MTTTAMQNRKDDYAALKQIPITEYAARLDYYKDEKKSSKTVDVIRNGSDRLLVNKAKNTFSSPEAGDGDAGSIFGFVLTRKFGLPIGSKLGAHPEVFRELREFLCIPEEKRKVPALTLVQNRAPAQPIEDFPKAWAAMTTYSVHAPASRYLQSRAIPAVVIENFKQYVRVDATRHRNTCFVHTDTDGKPTGWEIKNWPVDGKTWTRFAHGGHKLLWRAEFRHLSRKTRIVIGEAAIDVMSWAALNRDAEGRVPGGLYLSTAGEFGSDAREEVRKLLEANPEAEVISVFDDDKDGKKYTEQIREMIPGREVIRAIPALGKDFNEELKMRVEFGEVFE